MMVDGHQDYESLFWQFSLSFYGRPRVADACIQLQDNAAADVNVLLFLLFLASRNLQVDQDQVARIDAVIAPWRNEVVSRLRTLRRTLKAGVAPCSVTESDAMRNAIKRVGLDAEHIEQNHLARFGESLTHTSAASPIAAARDNLQAYGSFLNGLPSSAVDTIISAFSEMHREP